MTVVLYTNPNAPIAPVAADLWKGLQVTWTSPDGLRTWDLTDRTSGVVLASGSFQGMRFPNVDDQNSEAAGISGQQHRRTVAKAREIILPILVYSDQSSELFEIIDREFWDCFDFDVPGTLSVTSRISGNSRSVQARLTSDGGDADDHDPVADGYALTELHLIADQPFWAGETFSRSWQKVLPLTYLPASGAPRFRITSANSIATAAIVNPGRVDAWPTWLVKATVGAISATITVDGGTIVTPLVPEGQTLIITTDPVRPSAYLNGVKVSGQMVQLGWDPRPIPKQQQTPIAITITGSAGTVTASFDPLFLRCRP